MKASETKTLNRKQAAEYLGVSIVTVDRAVARKKLSCFRVGRRVLFSKEHLDTFLRVSEVTSRQ